MGLFPDLPFFSTATSQGIRCRDSTTMAPDPARVFYIVSSICDAVFLLVVPVRLWKLRGTGIKTPLGWQGLLKAVCIPHLI
jgi:hypothetical protein